MNNINKKLAEWVGLKDVQILKDHVGDDAKIHFEKLGKSQLYEMIEPFTKSLDSCFKWLMPKFVMQTGRDFITLPTTLPPDETARRLCLYIEQAVDIETGNKRGNKRVK